MGVLMGRHAGMGSMLTLLVGGVAEMRMMMRMRICSVGLARSGKMNAGKTCTVRLGGCALGRVSVRQLNNVSNRGKCRRRGLCAAAMGRSTIIRSRHARMGSMLTDAVVAVADPRKGSNSLLMANGMERRMQNRTKKARITARTWTTVRMSMIARTRVTSALRVMTKMMRMRADKALSMRSR